MCVQCDVRVVEGMYLDTVVTCFVDSVMLFLMGFLLFIFLFVHSYCKARCADI